MDSRKERTDKIVVASLWSVLGLAMLFCWSLTVHNAAASALSKDVPCKVTDQQS